MRATATTRAGAGWTRDGRASARTMRAMRTAGVGARAGGRGTREEGGTTASRARGCPATTTRAISEDAARGASGKGAKGYERWSTMTLGELIERAGELEVKVDGNARERVGVLLHFSRVGAM